jgi:hypothetical protein
MTHALVALLLAFAVVGLFETFDPAPPPMLMTAADFQLCVPINNGPLVSPRRRANGKPLLSETV